MSSALVDRFLAAAVQQMGGAPREGQLQMAQAVVKALEEDQNLLVQAGTGTGKSLAYLLPALTYAVERDQRVLVATATLALQRQIMEHDLPLAVAALGDSLGRAPVTALLKGRQNYLCRHKLAGDYPLEDDAALLPRTQVSSAGTSPLVEELQRLNQWAEETTSGDRDDFPGGATPRAWRQVSVTARQCLGGKCPLVAECFAEMAREEAWRADLVVTNHAMLAVHAGGQPVLPEHRALVVDEAHQLVTSVTSALTGSLGVGSVQAAAKAVRRVGAGAEKLDQAADRLEQAAASLDRTFEILLGLGTAPGTVKRLRGNLPEKLREALQVLASEVRAAGSLVRSAAEAPDAHKKSAEAALQEVTEMSTLGSAEAVPKSGTLAEATQSQPESSVEDSGKEKLDPSAKAADVKTTATKVANAKVVWLSRSGLNGEVLLYAAPLDVADSLAEGLFGHATAVLTSATLSVAGGLEAAAARVGLTRGEWEGLDVGSPFDYSHQGILYVASDLPEPGRDAAHQTTQHERLEQLVRAAQGGTLGLFTSQKAAEAAAETLRERLEVPILVQGEKSLPALMEEFVADEAACLFGTNSLWQGIDAPGRTCRLVTVDRLAFPRPDDPVMSARAEAADRAGLNGFMTVSAAHAALMLAQGAGRLIRSVEDRGVVAVLDPRLATKRYGAFLLASMPPLWRTESLEVVTAALERLAGGTPDK